MEERVGMLEVSRPSLSSCSFFAGASTTPMATPLRGGKSWRDCSCCILRCLPAKLPGGVELAINHTEQPAINGRKIRLHSSLVTLHLHCYPGQPSLVLIGYCYIFLTPDQSANSTPTQCNQFVGVALGCGFALQIQWGWGLAPDVSSRRT